MGINLGNVACSRVNRFLRWPPAEGRCKHSDVEAKAAEGEAEAIQKSEAAETETQPAEWLEAADTRRTESKGRDGDTPRFNEIVPGLPTPSNKQSKHFHARRHWQRSTCSTYRPTQPAPLNITPPPCAARSALAATLAAASTARPGSYSSALGPALQRGSEPHATCAGSACCHARQPPPRWPSWRHPRCTRPGERHLRLEPHQLQQGLAPHRMPQPQMLTVRLKTQEKATSWGLALALRVAARSDSLRMREGRPIRYSCGAEAQGGQHGGAGVGGMVQQGDGRAMASPQCARSA